MAPLRDDRRRSFRPLPPRPDRSQPFAETWWGDAWLEALEHTALDTGRLSRGRTYARGGSVLDIAVTPGRIAAPVQGSRTRPYRTEVRLRTLSDAQWDTFLDTVAEEPGRIAALLDKDMPHSLAQAAATAGVDLLPGPGDLAPRCSCPDWGYPCKHAAALCYQAARLLDADPFVLLLMRGRGEAELLEEFLRRNAARGAREARTEPSSAPARDALAVRALPPLPPPLPVPPRPGTGPVLPEGPAPVDTRALELLAADAAERAWALLSGTPRPAFTAWQDAVRLAAAHPSAGLTASTRTLHARLAEATGRTPAELARAVAAWRQGGAEGLAVLEEPWDPPAGPFDRARPALAEADLPRLRPVRNSLTDPARGLQLRFGRDACWYPYAADPGTRDPASADWWPAGSPDADPVGALTALLASDP